MEKLSSQVAFIVVALGASLLGGCGGSSGAGSYRSAQAPSGYAPSSDYAGGGGTSPAPATAYADSNSKAPSAESAMPRGGWTGGERAPAPPTTERQGLGTEWGESRESRVYDMAFVRNDPDRPFAVMALNYNDRAGVQGLMTFHERNGTMRRLSSYQTQEVNMVVRDANENPFETLRLGDRTYVVGSAGERYSIVLTNLTGHRFEAVATVDGLDVINGKSGNMHNRGYILMPYATVEIDGFRQSSNSVAAFRFGAVGDSYAAQKGNDRNVGVIGVALFQERGDQYPSERELRIRDNANPFPASDPRYAQPPRR